MSTGSPEAVAYAVFSAWIDVCGGCGVGSVRAGVEGEGRVGLRVTVVPAVAEAAAGDDEPGVSLAVGRARLRRGPEGGLGSVNYR